MNEWPELKMSDVGLKEQRKASEIYRLSWNKLRPLETTTPKSKGSISREKSRKLKNKTSTVNHAKTPEARQDDQLTTLQQCKAMLESIAASLNQPISGQSVPTADNLKDLSNQLTKELNVRESDTRTVSRDQKTAPQRSHMMPPRVTRTWNGGSDTVPQGNTGPCAKSRTGHPRCQRHQCLNDKEAKTNDNSLGDQMTAQMTAQMSGGSHIQSLPSLQVQSDKSAKRCQHQIVKSLSTNTTSSEDSHGDLQSATSASQGHNAPCIFTNNLHSLMGREKHPERLSVTRLSRCANCNHQKLRVILPEDLSDPQNLSDDPALLPEGKKLNVTIKKGGTKDAVPISRCYSQFNPNRSSKDTNNPIGDPQNLKEATSEEVTDVKCPCTKCSKFDHNRQ